MNRVLILAAGEPADIDAALDLFLFLIGGGQTAFELREKRGLFVGSRAGLLLGRHFVCQHPIIDPLPGFETGVSTEIEVHVGQVQISLAHRIVVAIRTIFRYEAFHALGHRLRANRGGGQARHCHHPQGERQ